MKDSDFGVLLEDIDDKLKAILEGQASMADVPQRLTGIENKLSDIDSDVKATKAAVTDQTKQLNNHETRITHLEAA